MLGFKQAAQGECSNSPSSKRVILVEKRMEMIALLLNKTNKGGNNKEAADDSNHLS